MKIHICSTEVLKKHQPNFKTGHYLDLPDGKVISIGEIADIRYPQNYPAILWSIMCRCVYPLCNAPCARVRGADNISGGRIVR